MHPTQTQPPPTLLRLNLASIINRTMKTKPSFILISEVRRSTCWRELSLPTREEMDSTGPLWRGHIFTSLLSKPPKASFHPVTWQLYTLLKYIRKLPHHISYPQSIINHQGRIILEDLEVLKLLKNKSVLKLDVCTRGQEWSNIVAWLQKVFRSDPENMRPVKLISVPNKTKETINPWVKMILINKENDSSSI